MSPDAVLRLDAVHVAAGATVLLANVTLHVQPMERVAIIGANGAGKTTLLKTLSGTMPCVSGSVEVLGHKLSRQTGFAELREVRTRIGQVFQGLHLIGRLSVLENVLVGALGRSHSILTCARVFPHRERERAYAALEAVGMVHMAELRVDRLSGGERQKVAIARALNQDTDLILADEPTANLDPVAAAEVSDLLTRIAEDRKVTLITVAHTLALLPSLAKRIVGLKDGRIVFDCSIDAIGESQLRALYSGAGATSPQDGATPVRLIMP